MLGVHLDAKSMMAAKNNKYISCTHWSPIRMMPTRLPNALWNSLIIQSYLTSPNDDSLSVSEKGFCVIQGDHRKSSNITNCRARNMFLTLIRCLDVILVSKRRWPSISRVITNDFIWLGGI